MFPRVVLVTGASRHLGFRLAARLAQQPGIDTVIGVDTVPPDGDVRSVMGDAEFVRADIRHPLIAKVISAAEVDTVVHLGVTATPMRAGGRSTMKETNVIGTMQLLAACQQAPSMRKLVVKSTTAVYGSSPRDPALFTEDDEPRAMPRSGYGKDAVEVEGYVRGFGRRRPDVAVTVFRFANFIGPRTDSPMTRYLTLPAVPTMMGFDPRLQFVHEDDALEVLRLAVVADRPGVFNVAGAGVLLMSQAIRRAGRLPVPVAPPLVSVLGRVARRSGLVDFSPEQIAFLNYGRVVDCARLIEEFGYQPRYRTAEAFEDFVQSHDLSSSLNPAVLEDAERALPAWLTGRPADA